MNQFENILQSYFGDIKNRRCFSMIDSVKTRFIAYRFTALSDGAVVTVGVQDDVNKLKQFNMKEQKEIFSGELKDRTQGLTAITVCLKSAIAFSF